MIVFRILSGGKEGKIVKSDLDVIYAGRKPECILQLDPYQDLSVHGQHAKIYSSNGNYYLEDLNSKNGTFVQDQAIKTPIQLRRGLIFRLGIDGPEIEVYNCKTTSHRIESKQQNSFLLKRLDKDTTFNFNKKSVRIGRQPDCELALDPLKNREVSGYHALICCREDGYHLEDLQSANGTFLNEVVCKNAKLKHLDIIQLGKEGPKFQFLYEHVSSLNSDSIINTPATPSPILHQDEPIAETKEVEMPAEEKVAKVKTSRKKKIEKQNGKQKVLVLFSKATESIKDSYMYEVVMDNFDKYKKETLILGSLFIIFIFVVLGAFSQKTYNKKSIYRAYKKAVVPIYTRYLIRINGSSIRGQLHSNGIVYTKNDKTIIRTLTSNLFPWEKDVKLGDNVEKIVHVVAVWPNKSPIFNQDYDYKAINFSYSYNNDQARIGGFGKIEIRKQENKISQITINKKIQNAYSENEVYFQPIPESKHQKIYAIYTNPNDEAKNNFIRKIVVEGYRENSDIVLDCLSNGAPVFNEYGEVIGLFFNKDIISLKSR